MQSTVDEAAFAEVVLKMVLGHTPGNHRHITAHESFKLSALGFYEFCEIFLYP